MQSARVALALWVFANQVLRFSAARFYDWLAVLPVVFLVCAVLASRWPWLFFLILLAWQHVFFGGAWFFPQLVVPYSAQRPCWPVAPLPPIVVLHGGSPARLAHIQHELAGYDFSLMRGAGTGSKTETCALLRAALANRTDPVVILEDDAKLHWGFARQTACSDYVDLVWLDARAAILPNVVGRWEGWAAGLRVNAPHKVAALLCGEFHRSVHAELSFDSALATACNLKKLTCINTPVVSEAGFASTYV